ncbi:MAG: Tad domain-containing protein [Bdellovibrio sp.]|nr:Tad domain-containing protein [Bdellovibrio sp.]
MMQKLRKIRLLPGFLVSVAGQAGQLSMFLAVTLIIIICLMAFIINVGLFVRAKINLQNAVDSAAYAGAATQARLLTQIAYVNWEMRNNYKEWLFKYYVFGQLGNPKVLDESLLSSGTTRFRLQPFAAPGEATYEEKAFDPFNLPSICIHPGSTTNICARSNVPGIPRFNTVGLPAISEKHEEFLNTVVAEKAKDCSRRTDLNFGTAMIWTYGPGGGQEGVANQGFSIAADRAGVYPKALELAFRIRNLEMILNRPPVTSICFDGCTSAPGTTLQSDTALNERPLKAFYSAWRNLDGGDSPGHQDLKSTFKLYELAPKSIDFDANSLSGYLIEPTAEYPGVGGVKALTKHYVDLQLLPIHYAIFFTAFVSAPGQLGDIVSEASCLSSKTAIPVPGLPVGFVKNPNVITYYAVKGEAKFIGLFYPFQKEDGITLTAYAAAKPMGGRIGPRLFKTDGTQVKPRGSAGSAPRSAHDLVGLKGNPWGWSESRPIPFTQAFYVASPGSVIGGSPVAAGDAAKFSIPNLIYDLTTEIDKHEQAGQDLVILEPMPPPSRNYMDSDFPEPTRKGLYDRAQFKKFFANLTYVAATGPTANDVAKALLSVRRPTAYDAMNYLVPAYYTTQNDKYEGPSVVIGDLDATLGVPYVPYQLYAPLMGDGTLFPGGSEKMVQLINQHITNSETAVSNYLTAIKDVATVVRNTPTAGNNAADGGTSLQEAADLIYPFPDPGIMPANHGSIMPNVPDASDAACAKIPMATKFAYFFQAQFSSKRCGIVPIGKTFEEYFTRVALNGGDKYLKSEFVPPDGGAVDNNPTGSPGKYMTGFMPGSRQGAEEGTGTIKHPFSGVVESLAKRNYYSVKFVAVSNLIENHGYFAGDFRAYIEKLSAMSPYNKDSVYGTDGVDTKNSLDTTQLSLFPTLDY